ncbi:MAG: alpha/beta hydrolase [Synergistaceae bacterium]|nr:alpha/beta hydrolase [Synergistaceae bacterium]
MKKISNERSPAAAGRRTRLGFMLLGMLAALLFFGVRHLLPRIVFIPSRNIVTTPGDYGLPFDDVMITTSDGVSINGWFVPAPEARGTLLFFHGNAGNISHRMDSIEIFHNLGLSVFIIDYRGFGRSGGSCSISGTTEDAAAAWRYLTGERGISPEDIVVFGRSIGGAVAMQLMARVKPRALILESTFSSLAEMIRVPFLVPLARLIAGGAFDSAQIASKLTVPTLFIHSPDDEIVPYRLGRRLYESAAGEKTFAEIHGGHNDGFLKSIDIYRAALDEFLRERLGEAKRAEAD